MTFTFYPEVPAHVEGKTKLISGGESHQYCSTCLVVKQDSDEIGVFEIRHEYRSTFSQAAIVGTLLMVGFEHYFYLYDIIENKNILSLNIEGYFGHFYINEDRLYVADAGSLYCVNMQGEIIWVNNSLGIDGVIIEKFDTDKIYGSGEWNPPGGWRNFVLDINTGKYFIDVND